MKCTKLLSKRDTDFWWLIKCTKLVMGEMCEISCKIIKTSTDICVVTNSRMIQLFVLSVYCEVWIWMLQNLRCLSRKSINFVLLVKPKLMSLFWFFGLYFCIWLFGMYETFYGINKKCELYALPLRYEWECSYFWVVSVVICMYESYYCYQS